MLKIYLDKEGMKFKKEIEELLEHEGLYNCDVADVEHEILSDDFTWVGGLDEISGTTLLHMILNIIENKEVGE